MVTATKPLVIQPDSEIGRLLEQASESPLVLQRNGVRYTLIREEDASPDDLFAGYDAEAAQAALDRVFGLLRDIDTEALKAELRDQREQESTGRPA